MSAGRGKFFWKLFLGNALLLVIVVAACVWVIVGVFDRFYVEELTSHLTMHARTLRHRIEDRFDAAHAAELDRLAKAIGEAGDGSLRITFALADGTVLGDSDEDPARMESHADRAEILQALAEGRGQSTRWSNTVSRDMKYVAVRVGPADRPLGVVRVSMALRSIIARAQTARQLVWTTAVVMLSAAVVSALGLALLWSRPISRITATARSLSQGDLAARADASGSDEIGMLARSLNQMRQHLANQLDTINHQRLILENLLTQLHEGVIVAGPDGRLILVNPAAARLLSLPGADDPEGHRFSGSTVGDLIQHRQLRELLLTDKAAAAHSHAAALADSSPANREPLAEIQECRLSLERAAGDITLLARAADIVLPQKGDPTGAGQQRATRAAARLLVLTDVTELTRTIQVKTDFVANASHELRTPLSAIRAAVETLLTMDLASDSSAARQLVHVLDRQSGRLEAIVADLLDLSRIESAAADFEPTTLRLADVIRELHDRFAARLADKKLQWHATVPQGDDTVSVSQPLLSLVLNNLVDNAIKFTPDGGRVSVTTERMHHALCLRVEDTGCGIPEEDRGRVFERFYQVERARSGMTRGTGLGLSIVRHAVNAMKGEVRLESTVGEGTSVTIIVPQPPAPTAHLGSERIY